MQMLPADVKFDVQLTVQGLQLTGLTLLQA